MMPKKKSKNTNQLYFEDRSSITFIMLPEGYFYKGKYHTLASCFKALLKDKEVDINPYPNGTWRFNNKLYTSLEELYEWEEDNISMPYSQFRRNYKECGVYHSPTSCTLYFYDRDDERELHDSKEEVINELAYYMSDYRFLADTEEYEEWYINTLSKEECIAYFKKSIKERIEILNNWKGNK